MLDTLKAKLHTTPYSSNIEPLIENALCFTGSKRLAPHHHIDYNLPITQNLQAFKDNISNLATIKTHINALDPKQHHLLKTIATKNPQMLCTHPIKEPLRSLIETDWLHFQHTRETLPKLKHQKRKRHLRHYKPQDKLKFCRPFERFWFCFFEPMADDFQSHLDRHLGRFLGFGFEDLCNALVLQGILGPLPIVQTDNYWNWATEFDILAVNAKGQMIIGECKWTNRPLGATDLNKILYKIQKTRLNPSQIVFFSKSGFSKNLTQKASRGLKLIGLGEIEMALRQS